MFRKYQKVERTKVLSPDNHKQVEAHLSKLGKHTVQDLTDEEREELNRELDKRTKV